MNDPAEQGTASADASATASRVEHSPTSTVIDLDQIGSVIEPVLGAQRLLELGTALPGVEAAMAAIAESNSQFRESLAKATAHIARQVAQVFASMESARPAMEAWRDQEAHARTEIAKAGWILPLSESMRFAQQVLRLSTGRSSQEIDHALMNYFDAERCDSLLISLLERPSVEPWRVALERAMAAHLRGEFELAIPIWLIALEGVARHEVGTGDLYSQARQPSELRERMQSGTGLDDLVLDPILLVLGQLGRRQSGPILPDAFLRRHTVLHGLMPSVGNKRDSIQSFLLLATLKEFWDLSDRFRSESTGSTTA